MVSPWIKARPLQQTVYLSLCARAALAGFSQLANSRLAAQPAAQPQSDDRHCASCCFSCWSRIFANQISPTRNAARIVAKGNQSPNAQYILGTSKQGQDIFAQVVHGTQISLTVGFLTGTIIIIIAIVVGVTAGYIGGWIDEVLSLITNVFLILPGLPLIIVVAGWLDRPGPFTVVLVLKPDELGVWGARTALADALTAQQRVCRGGAGGRRTDLAHRLVRNSAEHDFAGRFKLDRRGVVCHSGGSRA